MKFIFILFFIPFLYAGEKTVTLATTDWPPYYGKKLNNGGPIVEITKEAFKRVGIKSKVYWLPWTRAQTEVKNGKFSALLGAYKTPEREKYALYNSTPLGFTVTGIFSINRKDKTVDKLEALKGKRICHLRGTSVAAAFDNAKFLSKRAVGSESSCMMMVLKKRVQLVAGSQFVFGAILKKLNSKASLNPIFIFEKTPMFNAFSKKSPDYEKIKASFDKGLDLIKKDQTYEKIMKKHGF
ncbi:transporter substrate-binding domain-containing protein [Bacteriovoracales bacterium]|nr:transporter substrate-binding domain-containing protein [Bacteriovoracales bacterium]